MKDKVEIFCCKQGVTLQFTKIAPKRKLSSGTTNRTVDELETNGSVRIESGKRQGEASGRRRSGCGSVEDHSEETPDSLLMSNQIAENCSKKHKPNEKEVLKKSETFHSSSLNSNSFSIFNKSSLKNQLG